MCGETSAESASSTEISDAAEDASSFEAGENDELVESTEDNGGEEQENLLSGEKSETDAELCDSASSDQRASETDEDSNNIHFEDRTENSESAEKDKKSVQQAERVEIDENSEYSDEVNDKISSEDELEIYQRAGLKEENIDGRTCLIRDDIDMDYVDPKSGMTNQELMEKGRAPYDSKTGERIELHHIGQEYDSPLAELTADSEHGQHYSTLHTKETESWRNDEQKNNRYNNIDRPQHWKSRVKEH